jgi:copper(I)-binding protein
MRPIAFFFTAVFGLAVTTASAADYKAGSLEISDPWSRATPKGSSVAAGYMTIRNTGSTPDRLISGSSDVTSKFEVHEMKMENGVAKMRPVKGGLEIKPGETVELKPGSFHVMFVGLNPDCPNGISSNWPETVSRTTKKGLDRAQTTHCLGVRPLSVTSPAPLF